MTIRTEPVVEPFRLFHVRVVRTRRLSPSMVRITFTGEDLDRFADNGYDQRIKLILPLPGRGFTDLPVGPQWYAAWRLLPDQRRNPIRTYTARAVRPTVREVDLDMVLHGEVGPASRFAVHACPGDAAALIGPDRGFPGRHGGVEFEPPPGHRGPLLLAADETALPALAGILERLPGDARGEAVVEVPTVADCRSMPAPQDMSLTWAARDGAKHGGLLVAGLEAAAGRLDAASTQLGAGPVYAWLAGEASAVRRMRRHLVRDLGHAKRTVTFLGYWRHGRPEA